MTPAYDCDRKDPKPLAHPLSLRTLKILPDDDGDNI
jgi:hypothetical protein